MSTRYADIIDPQNIERIIAADYINEARLMQSGLVTRGASPTEGTHITTIKETLFSTDDEGQAIGVDTDITLKNISQLEFQFPVVGRADGGDFDDIAGEITPKRQSDAEVNVTNAISTKAAQMVDSAGIKIIDGCAAFMVTDGTNFNNANGSQVNLNDLEQTKSTRGEKGQAFAGGSLVMRGLMFHQVNALGLVAQTSNTMGNMKQGIVVETGTIGTILGMNLFSTDKIALESGGDHFIHFIEAGALGMRLADSPDIDPVIRSRRGFKDTIKFRVRLGGIIEGLSWSSAKANVVTNTDLSTGTNYELMFTNIKNVPMAVARFDAPTFA